MLIDIQSRLFGLRDLNYKEFHSKLIPNIDSELIIGVRTPQLRKLSKSFDPYSAARFMADLPHKFYEENNLHAFLIEQINDYDECISALNVFLPFVDNWATCDIMRPKVLKNNLDKLETQIRLWLVSDGAYVVRFAIELLMCYYLDNNFSTEYSDLVAAVKSREYYVNMMIAWYFATALAKQYDLVIFYFENNVLDKWIHNKSIQKAVESLRINEEQKEYLKKLKRR